MLALHARGMIAEQIAERLGMLVGEVRRKVREMTE
jgi:hypothetical protein